MALTTSARTLVAGVLVAIGTIVTAWLLEARVAHLEQSCKEYGTQEKAKAPAGSVESQWEMVCDRNLLDNPNQVGIQGQIAAADARREWWQVKAGPILLIAAAALCVPWIWYFLLRRIREISRAVSGRE